LLIELVVDNTIQWWDL